MEDHITKMIVYTVTGFVVIGAIMGATSFFEIKYGFVDAVINAVFGAVLGAVMFGVFGCFVCFAGLFFGLLQ